MEKLIEQQAQDGYEVMILQDKILIKGLKGVCFLSHVATQIGSDPGLYLPADFGQESGQI